MATAGEDGSISGPREDFSAPIFLVLMILIGSTTATAAKFAVAGLPLGLLPLARFGTAGLILLPLVWRGGAFVRMIRHDPLRLLAAGAFCVPINQFFFLAGTKLAPTSHVGVIYATCPLVVLLLASALGQEKLIPQRLVGVILSVAGVAVIGLSNVMRQGPGDFQTLKGDLLLIGAVVSWGTYLTANKPLVARYGSIPTLAGTFLVGGLIQLPIAIATFPGLAALEGVPASAWRGLVYLALVVTILGLACQNQALRRLDASQVATVGNAAPLLTITWGILFLGEKLSVALLVGSALTLLGILWASRRPERVKTVRIESILTPSEPILEQVA